MDDQTTIIYEPLFAIHAPLGIVDRVSFLCSQIAGHSVLHIGCADYPLTDCRMNDPNFLHRRLCGAAQRCVGFDFSKEGLAMMRQAGFDNLIQGDACRLSEFVHESFDFIVAGEVVEHLPNPGMFFSEAARCLKPGGAVFVTVPNAFNILRILRLLRGREVVHRDHCFYFSAKTLARLASHHGFRLESVGYTDQLASANWKPVLTWLWRLLIYRFPVFGQSVVAVLRVGDGREARHWIAD